MKIFGKNIVLILSIFIGLIGIAICFFVYYGNVNRLVNNYSNDSLKEVTEQQAFYLNKQIKDDMDEIKSLSVYIQNDSIIDGINKIKKVKDNLNFQNLLYVNKEGIGLSISDEAVDISAREHFKKAIKGETYIAEPVKSISEGFTIIIPMATPVYNNNNEIIGVLTGGYSIKGISQIMKKPYSEKGNICVINSKGYLLFSPDTTEKEFDTYKDFYNGLDRVSFASGFSKELFIDDIKSGRTGHSEYKYAGKTFYSYYIPLEVNDWFILISADRDIIISSSSFLSKEFLEVTLIISAIILAVFIAVLIDQILKRKEICQIAYYDTLTNIPNEKLFKKKTKILVNNNKQISFSCVVFDLSDFEFINERYGNNIGDEILTIISKIATDKINGDKLKIFARLYADTFAYFYPKLEEDNAIMKLEWFLKELQEKIGQLIDFKLDIFAGRYKASMGEKAALIFEKAILAHAYARNNLPNVLVDYDENYVTLLKKEIDIKNRFKDALSNGEFKPFFQPQFDIQSNKLIGAEALARWISDGKILYYPDDFIYVLERNKKIVDLDFYIFEEVCKMLGKLILEQKEIIPISVNFSRIHISNKNFTTKLMEISKQYNVPNEYLIIEITESFLHEDDEAFAKISDELHSAGYKVFIDDFGVGYASLSVLQNHTIDCIKFDKSFLDNMVDIEKSKSLFKGLIDVAKNINIVSLFEGVETKEQVNFLHNIGCKYVQGYYYARPMDKDKFLEILSKNKR